MELVKYGYVDYDSIDMLLENKQKFHYKFKATTGFIVGTVLDNVIPATFGLITMKLKSYGRVWYECDVKNRLINKLARNKYSGFFVRGFLE